jgi:IPT/TIG domain
MFTRTSPLRAAIGWTRAQRRAPRPRATAPLRSLFATALLLLSLLALNSNIGAAYATAPPPTVAKVKPGAGPGTGGTLVTIKGTNFTEATTVTFGSTDAASFTVKSATSITARSPAGTGTVNVTVTTPGGTSPTSSADHFTYLPAIRAAERSPCRPTPSVSATLARTLAGTR